MFRPHIDDSPFTALKVPVYRRMKLRDLHLLEADARRLAARGRSISSYLDFRVTIEHGEGPFPWENGALLHKQP